MSVRMLDWHYEHGNEHSSFMKTDIFLTSSIAIVFFLCDYGSWRNLVASSGAFRIFFCRDEIYETKCRILAAWTSKDEILKELNTDPIVRYIVQYSKVSKAVPLHAMKALGGRGVQLLLIHDLGTR
jgi:hypothetical protein